MGSADLEAVVAGKPFLQVKLVENIADCVSITETCKYACKYYLALRELPDVNEEMDGYISNYKKKQKLQISLIEFRKIGHFCHCMSSHSYWFLLLSF